MIQKSSLQFLSDLKENNNREWFLANKTRYENYKKDYHQFIADLLELMIQGDSNLSNLQVKNCTFRINRDIRFSKDKSPYKTHLGIWMSVNSTIKNAPGYYIQIDNENCFIAGGLYCPEASELKKIRKEIAFFYDELEEIVANKNFKKEFKHLERDPSQMLKTAPKDYEKDHPAIEFLKLKSVTASHKFDKTIVFDENAATLLATKLLALKPLNDFLNRAILTN
jgi:uncharacterized protein (TIGR02453 family)